ncbi:MAG: hypothetical protein ACTSRU_16645, partial [Candidatus Hodarchaeales archaeon]
MDQKAKKTYQNKAQIRALLVNPWSYYGVFGRGTGKSVRILAQRAVDLAYSMPGASFGWYGNTYLNLQANLIPNVIKGFEELGYLEGINFVVDKKPPAHFDKSLFTPKTYKHTIVWHTGAIFHLISDDRPDSANGRSLQHLLGDEIKLISYDKMKEAVFPAIRGERIHFSHVPQFQGFTFTTDMPDVEDGRWLLEKEQGMDPDKIKLILEISVECEKIKLDIHNCKNEAKKKRLNKELINFNESLNKLRKGTVYFDQGSTLINIDALGLDALDNMLDSLGFEKFKSSCLNIKPDTIENMFYANFSSKHLYTNFNYEYYDAYGFNPDVSSMGDKDCNPDQPLIAGVDFGNMDSMTLFQKNGNEMKAVKFMYVLAPDIIDDLIDNFANYYKHHRKKHIKVWYDRAANNRRNERNTLAEDFCQLLKKKGWVVEQMSIKWGNVPHHQRRHLWQSILKENDERYPVFRMNESNCKELKSSMQLAPIRITDGKIKKDKRSEQKKLDLLP